MAPLTLLTALAAVVAAVVTADGSMPDLLTRHNYKLAVKRPFFYMDNHTMPFYDYYGGALPSHDHIRLAQSSYGVKGSVWSKERSPHKEWMADIQLEVSGPGAVGGDGMAFWYTKDRGIPYYLSLESHPSAVDPTGASLGPVFGATDKWDGLAVVLDTYDRVAGNRNNPMISGLLNDGHFQFAGAPDTKSVTLGSCYDDYRNTARPVRLRVVHQKNSIEVYTDSRFGKQSSDPAKVEWHLCFRKADVSLPAGYYFGVSASAGQMPDNHDLISMDIYELNPPHMVDHNKNPDHPPIDPKLAERERKYEEIHAKIEEARLKQEMMHEMHSGGHHTPAGGSQQPQAVTEELVKLQATQFRILEQLESLAGGHGSSGGGSSSAVVERKLDDIQRTVGALSKAMETTMEIVRELGQHTLNGGGNSADAAADNARMAHLLKDISAKVDTVHQNTERTAAANQGIGTSGQQDGTAGGHSYLALLSLFLVGQAMVSAVRAVWKSRKSDQGKKFI